MTTAAKCSKGSPNIWTEELDDVTCREIQHHVRECIPCEACFNTLKRTVEFCREAESVPVPESFSLRLKEIVQSLARGKSS